MTEKVVIQVKEGQIRGVKEVSAYLGTPYYAFYGIPYAEPPLKNLAFKDPVKVKNWTNIYDGTTEKPGCTQLSVPSFVDCKFWGTDDCLFNNIYTTQLPCKSEPLRPVIVCIHGGSFFTGTPHTEHHGSPAFVMQHDVVYICISYRLHVLGFLNLGIPECSGNQGIKDIIMSLRWIKENAASFGGDPENVTLLGCSSGACIINILMISPAFDRSLFHKAVLMSGYVMNPVAPHTETNRHHAFEIAKYLGYYGNPEDYKNILRFLKRKSSKELIATQIIYEGSLPKNVAPITGIGVFSPTIDPEILPCSPVKLIDSMLRIPIIAGYCEREAMFGFTRGKLRTSTENNFKTSFCQNCWGWGNDLNNNEVNLIEKEMQLFYTNGQPIPQASLSVKVDIQSDICRSDFYDSLVDVIAADLPSSVFVYKFDFDGKLFTLKSHGNFDERLEGTYHGSEFSYWNRFANGSEDKESCLMVDSFTKLITTFARTGNPNYENLQVQWRPSTPENPCYLSINSPMKMVEGRINEERTKFWSDVKKRFEKD